VSRMGNHHGHTRPDEMMGREHFDPCHPREERVSIPRYTSAQLQCLKRRAAKKRRQRDRRAES